MGKTEKDTDAFKGVVLCLLFGFFAAGLDSEPCMLLFTLAAGGEFYGRLKDGEDLTSLVGKDILGIYIRYWAVLFIAALVSFALKKPLREHFVADSIYCFLGLHFTFCAEWRYIPAFVLVLASAPVLVRISEREKGSLSSDILLLVLFAALPYLLLPIIRKTLLFSALSASLLGKSLCTAFRLIPAFTAGILLAKYSVVFKIKNRLRLPMWLDRGLRAIGEMWLSMWLVGSFLCNLLGKYVFALQYKAAVFLLLLAVCTLCAGFLERTERRIVVFFK